MSSKRVGIDIGNEAVHMAIWNGSAVTNVITEPLPQGLVRDDRVLSFDALGDFFKEVRKKHRVRVKDVSLVLHGEDCYCRRFTMPVMTVDQLKINLPYEFRDFVREEKDKYNYDHAVVDILTDENGNPSELDLMAACVLRETVDEYAAMFHRAGFRLRVAVPETMAYVNLLRRFPGDTHSHCIMDLGSAAFQMFMFQQDRYEADRQLDLGCIDIDRVIADELHVDIHIAHAYRESDTKAQTLPRCLELYNAMAIEVLKAVNFYDYNHRDDQLEHIHCCGGGSRIEPLMQALQNTLPIPLEGIHELLPDLAPELRQDVVFACAALGAAVQ